MTSSERATQVWIQRLCAYCGPAFLAVCFIGLMVLCRFVPPPSPADTMARTAEIFRTDLTRLRLGLIVMVFGSALLAPFVSVISVQMKRIEGARSPLTYVQLVLGACLVIEFILPMMALQAAAFRPDRPAAAIQALNDWGWMSFYGATCTAVLEAIVIGVAILGDRRSEPLLPRWSGYFNIWVGLLFAPGAFLVCFTDGPLAWNGLFAFWVPFGAFFLWVGVMTILLVRSASRPEEPEDGAAGPAAIERLVAQSHHIARLESRLDELHRRLEGLASASR